MSASLEVLLCDLEILKGRVSVLEAEAAGEEHPLRVETLESSGRTIVFEPPMTPEEGKLTDVLRDITGVSPIIEPLQVSYVYLDLDGRWAVRTVPRVGATRLLDTLRQVVRSCRLDHNESQRRTK